MMEILYQFLTKNIDFGGAYVLNYSSKFRDTKIVDTSANKVKAEVEGKAAPEANQT